MMCVKPVISHSGTAVLSGTAMLVDNTFLGRRGGMQSCSRTTLGYLIRGVVPCVPAVRSKGIIARVQVGLFMT